ncbi:PREDICTED: uncharacterized protein LOC106742112 [Dinoponera quadriceps]|uniref:Uncharacterized protein LOC106742112 n=1 Tax=Dinoponera quadriceps TaxID=609295 RepID=A0A6P3WW07_DINQU|nr:PREDICTED: uncharacterized protein LOC106742112 [Dinoponera quadriceps]
MLGANQTVTNASHWSQTCVVIGCNRRRMTILVEVPNMITCNRYEKPEVLERCLKSSINSIKPYLATGVEALQIPSFEPYFKENYEFISGKEFNGFAKLTDPTTYGLTKFKLNKVRVNADLTRIELEAYIPYIEFFAIYCIDAVIFGKYLQKGDRTVRMEISGIAINATIDGEYYVDSNNKEEYFRVINVPVELRMGEVIVYLNNNKRPHRLLGEINELLQNNNKQVAREIMPKVKKFASNAIRLITDRIFSNIPMSLIMPINYGVSRNRDKTRN